MNRVFLVPGIHNIPFSSTSWHNTSERILEDAGVHASTHAYTQFAFRSNIKQHRVAHHLSRRLKAVQNSKGFPADVICHSNGHKIVELTMKLKRTRINTLIILFGAGDSDLTRSGLELALQRRYIRRIYCIGSRNDKTVKFGNKTTGWLRRFSMWGYGGMSYKGPKFSDPLLANRVHTLWFDEWGHSTFAKEENIEKFFLDTIIPILNP